MQTRNGLPVAILPSLTSDTYLAGLVEDRAYCWTFDGRFIGMLDAIAGSRQFPSDSEMHDLDLLDDLPTLRFIYDECDGALYCSEEVLGISCKTPPSIEERIGAAYFIAESLGKNAAFQLSRLIALHAWKTRPRLFKFVLEKQVSCLKK